MAFLSALGKEAIFVLPKDFGLFENYISDFGLFLNFKLCCVDFSAFESAVYYIAK